MGKYITDTVSMIKKNTIQYTLPFENCTIRLDVGRKWEIWWPVAPFSSFWSFFILSGSLCKDEILLSSHLFDSLREASILPTDSMQYN